MANKKTVSHNRRRHNRGGKNVFWLAMNTYNLCYEPVLTSRYPKKKVTMTGNQWRSSHSKYYPNSSIIDRLQLDKKQLATAPIQVTLAITTDDKPDLYIQRKGQHLFISSFTNTDYTNTEVPHYLQLSKKLFPEVTEENGITRINIEII